jgi:hypothetical protein
LDGPYSHLPTTRCSRTDRIAQAYLAIITFANQAGFSLTGNCSAVVPLSLSYRVLQVAKSSYPSALTNLGHTILSPYDLQEAMVAPRLLQKVLPMLNIFPHKVETCGLRAKLSTVRQRPSIIRPSIIRPSIIRYAKSSHALTTTIGDEVSLCKWSVTVYNLSLSAALPVCLHFRIASPK